MPHVKRAGHVAKGIDRLDTAVLTMVCQWPPDMMWPRDIW